MMTCFEAKRPEGAQHESLHGSLFEGTLCGVEAVQRHSSHLENPKPTQTSICLSVFPVVKSIPFKTSREKSKYS